jgi:hypothetical protein
VFAIELSNIVKECRKRVAKSGYESIIKIMQIRAEQAPIEENALDAIVSEWMGYFLVFERMLPSVLAVRDKSLKPGGTLIPRSARIIVAAFTVEGCNEKAHEEMAMN